MVAGLAAAGGELAPYFTAGASPEQRINALASYSYHPGASTASKTLLLDDCHTIANSVLGMAQSTERRQALVTACVDYASAFVADSPVNAHGWLVLAEMAADLGNADALNYGLRQSRLTAPVSASLAEDRLQVLRKHLDLIDDGNRDGMGEDVLALMRGDAGVRTLARLYDDAPALREPIAQVVETLDADRQRRFLQAYARTGRTAR